MDSSRSVLHSAKHFFFGTLLSRFSGLMRDMSMAFCFGSTPEVAAFMVAYRLANLCRRLFGEGNIQAGFVPHFEQLKAESNQAAARFYRDSAWSMSIVFLGVVVLLEAFLALLHSQLPEDWKFITKLAMWMVPGLFFICLYSLHTAILQCQKKAFWSGFAPVAFNFAWIAAAFLSTGQHDPMRWLSIGITVAFGFQWLLTAWQVRKELKDKISWADWMRPHLFTGEWRSLLKPMALGIIGVGAMQINSALDAIFSQLADPSGPAFLWYAIRIQNLPLALFGIGLARALLPPLARAEQQNNPLQFQTLLAGGLKHMQALIIPCTFGLFALGLAGINLLFGRGDFSGEDVRSTLDCLLAYGVGLLPSVLVFVLSQGHYAKKNYRTPSFSSLVAVGVNVLLNAWLVFGLHWGAPSIAVATSLSAWVNYFILSHTLKAPTLFDAFFWKISLASAVAAAASLMSRAIWVDSLPREFSEQIIQFSTAATLFLGSLLGMAKWLGITELFELVKKPRTVDPGSI
jgi:putative peptidoglycan lipid II flippase